MQATKNFGRRLRSHRCAELTPCSAAAQQEVISGRPSARLLRSDAQVPESVAGFRQDAYLKQGPNVSRCSTSIFSRPLKPWN